MSIDVTTGEIVAALSHDEAERLTTRIALKLDAMADTYAGVMPLIREAIARDAHAALGYASVGAYVTERFGDALAKLGLDVRREVVRELTEAGLSTRAIGAVTGTSKSQVARDQAATVPSGTVGGPVIGLDGRTRNRPTPKTPEPTIPQGEPVSRDVGSGQTSPTAAPDPEPEPRPAAPRATPRRPLPDQFFDAAYDAQKKVESLHRLIGDDRFTQNAEKVAAKHRNDLLRVKDLLEQVINSLPEQESSR